MQSTVSTSPAWASSSSCLASSVPVEAVIGAPLPVVGRRYRISGRGACQARTAGPGGPARSALGSEAGDLGALHLLDVGRPVPLRFGMSVLALGECELLLRREHQLVPSRYREVDDAEYEPDRRPDDPWTIGVVEVKRDQ